MYYIQPLECPHCANKGYIGEIGAVSIDEIGHNPLLYNLTVHCLNGHDYIVEDPQMAMDHMFVQSTSLRLRLHALADGREHHRTFVTLGQLQLFQLVTSFEYREDVDFMIDPPYIVLQHNQENRAGIWITLASEDPSIKATDQSLKVLYTVYGLRDLSILPTWRILLFNSVLLAIKGMYKLSLIECASAFEIALEACLSKQLSKQYNGKFAKGTLNSISSIERRFSMLFPIVTGHMHTEVAGLYAHWQTDVQGPRNRAVHDNHTPSEEDVNMAQITAYGAIRWIEDLFNTLLIN